MHINNKTFLPLCDSRFVRYPILIVVHTKTSHSQAVIAIVFRLCICDKLKIYIIKMQRKLEKEKNYWKLKFLKNNYKWVNPKGKVQCNFVVSYLELIKIPENEKRSACIHLPLMNAPCSLICKLKKPWSKKGQIKS